jgi:hypothetical protein
MTLKYSAIHYAKVMLMIVTFLGLKFIFSLNR